MKYTNTTNIPLPLAIWLASDSYMYAKTANEISATTLMKSPRYIIATRRAMFPEQFKSSLKLEPELLRTLLLEDISNKIASRMGTAIHSAIDQAITGNHVNALTDLGYEANVINKILINPEPDKVNKESITFYTENRMYKDILNFSISGQYDVVINGELHDIKTTSTFTYTNGLKDKDYIIQGSIYKWLNPELVTGSNIVINFLFTDWSKNYALSREDYPKCRALGKSYELWSLDKTESYIKDKLNTINQYWEAPLEEIPCCTEDQLYSSKPVYKYYKGGYAEGKRSTKNFDTHVEATLYRGTHNNVGEIIVNKGAPFYCPCCQITSSSNIENLTTTLEII